MEEKKKTRREEFTIRIGPLLIEVLKKQLEQIKKATYDVCDTSYWEAGEIIAKKISNEV